jgi:transcriptional regulator with XRE-family HTH domain
MAPTSAGTRIRLRRQALKLTQQQLADKLGVDRATVSAWERGKHYPDRNEGAVEAVLGISLAADAPDPQVLEIRAMTWLTAAEQDQWIALYEARKPPQERAG